MAKSVQTVKAYIWAVYYNGRFSDYQITHYDMSEQDGWIKVKDVTVEFEHDPNLQPTAELVEQLKAKARLMQATFEAAHGEVLDEINKLLAIGMDDQADSIEHDDDIPF